MEKKVDVWTILQNKSQSITQSVASYSFLSRRGPRSPGSPVTRRSLLSSAGAGAGLVVILFAGALLRVIREQRQEANASDSPEIETKTLLCQWSMVFFNVPHHWENKNLYYNGVTFVFHIYVLYCCYYIQAHTGDTE